MRRGARSRVTKCELIGKVPGFFLRCKIEPWAPRAAVVIAVALVIQRFSCSFYLLFACSSSKEVSRTKTGSLG
jgi:hypothetical protein